MILFPCFVGLLSLIVLTISDKTESSDLPQNHAYMDLSDLMMSFYTTLPMLVTMIICVVMIIMSAMLA